MEWCDVYVGCLFPSCGYTTRVMFISLSSFFFHPENEKTSSLSMPAPKRQLTAAC